MTPSKKKISCPTCGKKETWTPDNAFRPFCSERCKLIDLGEWASGSYQVGKEKVDPEQLPPEDEK